MKKSFVLLMAFAFFIAACNNNKTGKNQNLNNRDKDDYGKNDNRNTDDNKDESGQKNSWSSSDIRSFNEQCLTTVNNNEEVAKTFCPCLLEKFQSKYSSLAEMDKNGTEEEGKRAGEECMALIKGKSNDNTNVAGGWPQAERDAFITNCVKNAMAVGRSRPVAQNYCDCMLNKMETLYPDVQDISKLTNEDLQSPAMKKMANDCLNDN